MTARPLRQFLTGLALGAAGSALLLHWAIG